MKMKMKIYNIMKSMVFPMLMGVTLISCIDGYNGVELDKGGVVEHPTIVLTFDTNDSETRALTGETTPFTETERKLNTVDIFFYKSGSTTPVKVESVNEKKHGDKISVSLTDDETKDLFGLSSLEDTGSCIVYAVANVSDEDYTASGVTKASATVEQLRTIKANTPSFATEFDGFAMFTKKESGDVISYSNMKAEGRVQLKNLAAKIDVFVKFESNIQDTDGDSWNVATNKGKPTAEVHIINGVTAVTLNGLDKNILTDNDYYSIRNDAEDDYRRGLEEISEEDEYYKAGFLWASDNSYYSYPNLWEDTPLEQYATYLLLKVDWTTYDETEIENLPDFHTTYYKVPIDIEGNQLQSNRYYRLKLNITTLGGENFGEPLEIEGEWEVLDWGHASLKSDLREVRYLEVSQKQTDIDGTEYTVVINGDQGLVTIPFKSSHETEIESVNISYTSYIDYTNNGASNRKEIITDPGKTNAMNLTVSSFEKQALSELENNNHHCAFVDNVNHTVTIKHNIGATTIGNGYYYPNTAEQYMYYTYYITIKLKHTNSTQDFENSTIKVVHHPAIYVSGETNEGYNFTWNALAGANASQDRSRDWSIANAANIYGWTRVNNNSYDGTEYGGLSGLQKMFEISDIGSNKSNSPIMYVVTVSQLDGAKTVGTQQMTFHIRDPRVTESNTLQSSGWASAPHYQNGKLLANSGYTLNQGYYYPTNRSEVDEVKYAMSPRFRMASSFGNPKNNITTLEEAEKRCASYQEAGYPAGRWRLPTFGEMAFVTYLSKKQLIPPLFGGRVLFWSVDAKYWCAQGLYKIDDNGNLNAESNSGTRYVRCVYDDWYWVREDGVTPDRIKNPYNLDGLASNGTVFIWGDKKKNNPQDANDKN